MHRQHLYELQKEQGLPQICNVAAAIAVDSPPSGLVMAHNGKRVNFLYGEQCIRLSRDAILPACGR